MTEDDRMRDLESMQNLHRDFSDVVMTLNKFRVELSFTKMFGAVSAAKDRHMLSSLSKLKLYGFVV